MDRFIICTDNSSIFISDNFAKMCINNFIHIKSESIENKRRTIAKENAIYIDKMTWNVKSDDDFVCVCVWISMFGEFNDLWGIFWNSIFEIF